jgi:hypothetical protein
MMVQQAITGLLWQYSQSQGRHPSGHVRVNIPAAVMHYLQLWVMHRNIIPSHKPYSQMQKHIRAGIIFQKTKVQVTASCWKFDTEAKVEVLSQLLGLNINVGIRRRPPELGSSYSITQNYSLNVVIGNIDAADNRGIDLLYHVPFLDIYVRSSEYIVGGMAPPPTDQIRAHLEAVPTTSESNKLIITIQVKGDAEFSNGQFCFPNYRYIW